MTANNNYKLIYSGFLKSGVDEAQFVQSFMRTFKVSEADALKLVSLGRSTTLKDNLDMARAEKLRQVMDKLGMRVHVEPIATKQQNMDDAVVIPPPRQSSDQNTERCPKCGSNRVSGDDCNACGIIISRYLEREARLREAQQSTAKAAFTVEEVVSNISTSPIDEDMHDECIDNASFVQKLVLGFARFLRFFFPPLNETTVFVVAVTLYTTFIYVDGAPSPFEVIVKSFGVMVDMAKESALELIKTIFIGPIIMMVILAIVIGPIMLPFTKKDLRWTCALVIGIFAVVVTLSAIYGFFKDPNNLLNRMILIYSMSWFAYLIFIIRFIKEPGFIMSDEQAEPISASAAALVAVISVYLANKHYAVPWHAAFVVGVTSSASIVPLIIKLISMPFQSAHKSGAA